MSAEQRHHAAQVIAAQLETQCRHRAPQWVGLYWPIKFEPNLLAWAAAHASDLRFCLPVIIARGEPLEYWQWTPGEAMKSGVWGIQVPAHREVVLPDIIVAPLVGFDHARFRLGNGGGYFDRTLAARTDKPFVIGVGYAAAELATVHPQPHDIPMDLILTERS